MELNRKKYPLAFFILALPALVITDWYIHGFGIAILFVFITVGLIIEQIQRINYPKFDVDDTEKYKKIES